MSASFSFGPDATATISLAAQIHKEESDGTTPVLTSTRATSSGSAATGVITSMGSIASPGFYEVQVGLDGESSAFGNNLDFYLASTAAGLSTASVAWRDLIAGSSQVYYVRRFKIREPNIFVGIAQNSGVNARFVIQRVEQD